MPVFVNYAYFSKNICRNYACATYFLFGKNSSITEQLTRKGKQIFPIHKLKSFLAHNSSKITWLSISCKVFTVNGSFDNRDAHALSPVERILGHFLWEAGPMNVTIRRQK